ncbi:hypothetical protein [Streptomyces sp. CHB9.2]|uniref:hypothetical protein n=1 Tax=Streptomyces sp. CHB9.2 TaxID=2841670 RepID=UPI002095539A|nr:hypothetical protein [Streptomyces sp. CHB9.2]MCO6704746.1 hypothetical protein [Streptomyces sp. CHB9.2]
MSLIVRKLKEYHTNRSHAFVGTRCFLLTIPIQSHLSYYEIASGNNLDHYCFYATRNIDGPMNSTAAAIKRTIKHQGMDKFMLDNAPNCIRWDSASTIEMDWSNPPKEEMMAVLVQIKQGQPDFSAPALFMYVPEAIRKRRAKLMKIPKGTGPIPHRLGAPRATVTPIKRK